MNREDINPEEKITMDNQVINTQSNKDLSDNVSVLQGAISVPKDQKFKHLNLSKKDYYGVYNPKFASLVANPLISEKTMALASNGYYTFEVNKQATKRQIAHAIEKIFGIAVVEVKTVRTGTMVAHWSHKKKKNLKKEVGKKALVKFIPEVEIDMEKIQTIMQNRENIMER